jgi:hypothetical protein
MMFSQVNDSTISVKYTFLHHYRCNYPHRNRKTYKKLKIILTESYKISPIVDRKVLRQKSTRFPIH